MDHQNPPPNLIWAAGGDLALTTRLGYESFNCLKGAMRRLCRAVGTDSQTGQGQEVREDSAPMHAHTPIRAVMSFNRDCWTATGPSRYRCSVGAGIDIL